ncbi:hypothetical protein BY996DRAFT_7178562 [Phakopsora pachyrhizi]|nr:hypothetical protein BY996DRAFT_7178562 [Phakopsora pachyrhizi]
MQEILGSMYDLQLLFKLLIWNFGGVRLILGLGFDGIALDGTLISDSPTFLLFFFFLELMLLHKASCSITSVLIICATSLDQRVIC